MESIATYITVATVLFMGEAQFGLGFPDSVASGNCSMPIAQQSISKSNKKTEKTLFGVDYSIWKKAEKKQLFVVTAKTEDKISINPVYPDSQDWGLSEGHYLAIILPSGESVDSLTGATVAHGIVKSVGLDQNVLLSVAPVIINKIKKNQKLLLFRPLGSTTEKMRNIPRVSIVKYIDLMSKLSKEKREVVIMADRLRAIGKALHDYHDFHGHYPPAVVYGPDGKPWHSWRTLLTSELHNNIFNEYRWEEPWDSQHNRRFIKKCPEIFQAFNDKRGHTPFVVVTGKNTAFPAIGAKNDGDANNMEQNYGSTKNKSAVSADQIIDGSSNTIHVGTVEKSRTIPWTKPAELTLTDKFPGIGKKNGFAAPYTSYGEKYGLFLLTDGAVIGLETNLHRKVLFDMLTINDRNLLPFSLQKVSVGRSVPSGILIKFERKGNKSVCIIEEVTSDSELPPIN